MVLGTFQVDFGWEVWDEQSWVRFQQLWVLGCAHTLRPSRLPPTLSAPHGAEEGAGEPWRLGEGWIQALHVGSIIHRGLEGLLPLPLSHPARGAAGTATRFAQLEGIAGRRRKGDLGETKTNIELEREERRN